VHGALRQAVIATQASLLGKCGAPDGGARRRRRYATRLRL